MPNRILKETICTSDNLDRLTAEEERFFYRLIVQCDDFGRLDARPAILLAACFPLKVQEITPEDISRWLTRLSEEHLIALYTVDSRPYLQLVTWHKHQSRRAKYSKYPAPEDTCKHMHADASRCSRGVEESRNRGGEETRNEKDPLPPPTTIKDVIDQQGDRYTSDQLELIRTYWDTIKFTRKTGRIAPSVVAKELEYWERFDPSVVEEALETHLEQYETKRERYTRGIMRGVEEDRRLGKARPPKKPVDDVAESWEGVRPDAERDPRKYHP